MGKWSFFFICAYYCVIAVALAGRQKFNPHVTLVSAGSQDVPKVGYLYPVPTQGAASTTRAQLKFPVLALPRPSSQVERLPSASAQEPSIQQLGPTAAAQNIDTEVEILPREDEIPTTTVESETTTLVVPLGKAETDHQHHPQIDTIDVACGKDKMTVRFTFDSVFDGIIYAKGHYAEPNCRFVTANSGESMYQFELTTGECGVSFIDDGLTEGGQAYVEALLVIIVEPGVQEAWDASRKIRCLWEGNLEQTVTFPLTVNMLEQKLLTFSGDTASVALEIQAGDGPRAAPVQGLVRIGDMLTAVVTVQGDSAFDLLVRNCVATDGTPTNRIILSDTRGCATKPKLMGGWIKEKGKGNVLSYAKLSAFKFPDVMDLFLECTVSLCKGACEECPATEYLELLIPAHDDPEDISEDVTLPTSTSTTSTSTTTETSSTTTTTTTTVKPVPNSSNLNVTETSTPAVAASVRIESVKPNTKQRRRIRKRSTHQLLDNGVHHYNVTGSSLPQESLKLRRVVHVVGPDDFPEFSFGNFGTGTTSTSTVYGSPNGTSRCQQSSDCFSLLGIVSAVSVTALFLLLSVAIYGTLRRHRLSEKC